MAVDSVVVGSDLLNSVFASRGVGIDFGGSLFSSSPDSFVVRTCSGVGGDAVVTGSGGWVPVGHLIGSVEPVMMPIGGRAVLVLGGSVAVMGPSVTVTSG